MEVERGLLPEQAADETIIMGGGSMASDDLAEEDICAGCGAERSAWKGDEGRGYTMDGLKYCCQRCAEGFECSCGV
jgi:hypothetical protein